MKHWLKWIISFLFLGLLFYFLRKVDLKKASEVFLAADFPVIILALLAYALNYLTKALRLKLISSYYKENLSVKDALVTTVIAIAFASYTPGRLGEFVKIYLLNRTGIKGAKPLGMTVLERLLDFMVLSIFSLLFFITAAKIKKLTIAMAVFLGALSFGFVLLCHADRVAFLLPQGARKYLKDLKIEPKDPLLYAITLMTVFIWFIEGFCFLMIILSFGQSISLFAAVGIYGSMVIISLLSILPGGLGALDISILFFFNLFHIHRETSLAILLILRIISFVIPVLLTLLVMPFTSIELFKLKARMKETAPE